MDLLFFGNDCNLIKALYRDKRLKIIGIIAEPNSNIEERYFGSIYTFSKKRRIPIILVSDFRKNPLLFLNKLFKEAEIGFSQGYRYIISKEEIRFFRKGIINFHQSYLPAYRGRHPLNWSIINGEKTTGATFHFMAEDFDDGKIILQRRIKILSSDTIMTLYDKTIKEGMRLIPAVFTKVINKEKMRPQKGNSSYFPARSPEDGEILLTNTVKHTIDLVRGLVFPYPGAFLRRKKGILIIEKVSRAPLELFATQSKGCTGLFWHKSRFYLKLVDGCLRIDKIRFNEQIISPNRLIDEG